MCATTAGPFRWQIEPFGHFKILREADIASALLSSRVSFLGRQDMPPSDTQRRLLKVPPPTEPRSRAEQRQKTTRLSAVVLRGIWRARQGMAQNSR